MIGSSATVPCCVRFQFARQLVGAASDGEQLTVDVLQQLAIDAATACEWFVCYRVAVLLLSCCYRVAFMLLSCCCDSVTLLAMTSAAKRVALFPTPTVEASEPKGSGS